MAITNEVEVAITLAHQAGAVAVAIRDGGALGVELKPGDEPVTRADRAASELIVAGLAAAAQLVKLSGRSVASVDEAKQLLWPNGGHN